MRSYLGEVPMMAYLAMMAPRLLEMKRILKDTGSIYLHCDPTASHYLKLLMDAVFGGNNFRNEIVWCYLLITFQRNTIQYFGIQELMNIIFIITRCLWKETHQQCMNQFLLMRKEENIKGI